MLSIINTYLYSGASIFVENKSILQREFWENYKKNKITSFSGVPYIFETLIKLGFEKILTKNLREITQAGGKLNTETQKKIADICKKNKIKFFIMYGQTEASPRISYLDSKFASKKIGSIGKAVPGTQMWLEDLNQKIIKKPNQIGELKIKGKNVSLGYSYKFEDLNNKDENKGVLRTGDLAFFDKDNFYFLKGRKDRIIKIFGNRLSLDELEAKMNEIGFSLICNVEGNKIKVFFEKEYNIIDLKNKISEVSNQNSSIFDFKLIKKIPRTSSDKIDYKKLNTL